MSGQDMHDEQLEMEVVDLQVRDADGNVDPALTQDLGEYLRDHGFTVRLPRQPSTS